MTDQSEATVELELVGDLFNRAKVRGLRTLSQFAEDEVRVPSGPHEGMRFQLDRHPVSKLLFTEIESGRWQRMFITGPNQDGKTFMAFVIIILYLLFERGERVVMGVPTGDIASDKWQLELKPVIAKTRYADLLPSSGGGAKGGMPETILFGNGAALRLMTAGGDDQSRAAFTTPNVVVTETEGFDEVGSNSREGSKFAQLEKRVLAYDEGQSRVIAECTVSFENGRTWHEYTNGSQSRIAIRCPHCKTYVTPEREHFSGWQQAASEDEAAELAAIHCPDCGVAWSNDDRLEANRLSVLAHKGQTVDKAGVVQGDLPKTSTLGFRWTCVNAAVNPNRMKRVARQEWKAANVASGEAAELAEKDLLQMQWVLPAKSQISEVRVIEATRLQRQMLPECGFGVVPDDVEFITVGCDVGKWLLHWTAVGHRRDGSEHVIEYSRVDVPSSSMSEDLAIPNALRQLKDRVDQGWSRKDGTLVYSTLNWVDAGWHQWIVLAVVAEFGEPWYASKGYGVDQRKSGEYKRDTGSRRLDAGEGYAYIELPTGHQMWEFDADHWKAYLHNRAATPIGKAGTLTLPFTPKTTEHLAFVKHLLNEKQVEEFVPGGGLRKRFVNPTNLPNHWLDSTVLATVAGHVAGSRVIDPEAPAAETSPALKSDDATDEKQASQAGGAWVPQVGKWINQ